MERARRTRLTPVQRELPPRAVRRIQDPAPTAHASRAAGVILAVLIAALLVVHGLALATAAPAAGRTLGALLPVLTDLDQALAAHGDELKTTPDNETATVPGLPISVEVSGEAAQQGGDRLRRDTLNALTDKVYAEGAGVFRASDAPAGGSADPFSSAWAVERSLDMLTRGAHDRLVMARWVLGAAALLLTGLLLVQVDGQNRLQAVGSALAAGGVAAAVLAAVARGLLTLVASGYGDVGSAVARRAIHDLSMTVVGVALVCLAVGVLVAGTGILVPRLGPRPARAVRAPTDDMARRGREGG